VSAIRKLLIAQLESLPLLEGRFESIRCVNYDPIKDQTRGCFSLVFRAHDIVEDRSVALKFYDVDIASINDAYRVSAFDREVEILTHLIGRKRCLQLVRGLNVFPLKFAGAAGVGDFELPCKYFSVDWIEEQIDEFFSEQENFDAQIKLKLFNEIVLAVEALHRQHVHHRDLKPDNLRLDTANDGRPIVVIDFGTAARLDSASLRSSYGCPAGAPAYSAPEARAGFSGDRSLGPYSDAYALGCLLFELFNPDHYFYVLRMAGKWEPTLAALALRVSGAPDGEKRCELAKSLDGLRAAARPVPVSSLGSTLPTSIRDQIDELAGKMTAFDYRQRLIDLAEIRRLIWAAIRVLENVRADRRRAEQRRLMRERRAARLLARDQRLAQYLQLRRQLSC
jgi:serine/threonine protein kinase